MRRWWRRRRAEVIHALIQAHPVALTSAQVACRAGGPLTTRAVLAALRRQELVHSWRCDDGPRVHALADRRRPVHRAGAVRHRARHRR
jgi:hypothetical protein